jgi:hypothetical protein
MNNITKLEINKSFLKIKIIGTNFLIILLYFWLHTLNQIQKSGQFYYFFYLTYENPPTFKMNSFSFFFFLFFMKFWQLKKIVVCYLLLVFYFWPIFIQFCFWIFFFGENLIKFKFQKNNC